MNSPSPCTRFVPAFVTMFSAGPDVQPNSAEKAFDSVVISWMAPMGTVAIIVCRPQPSSLLAPSSVTVVWRRPPAPVTKYVALTNRSPVPFAGRNAALNSGSVVTLRPRMGVASIVPASSGLPICGLALTPSVVPYTVTSLCPPEATSFILTIAVSPARSVRPVTSSAVNPALVTLTVYVPVSDRAATVADPSIPDTASRAAPVCVFATEIAAPGTTPPV